MQHLMDWNGEFLPHDLLVLPVSFTQTIQITQLTESIRVYNGKAIFEEAHYFHLMSSMRILRLQIPMDYTPTFFNEKVTQFIQKLELNHAILWFSVGWVEGQIKYWITAKNIQPEIIQSVGKSIEIFRESTVSNSFYNQLFTPNPFEHPYQVYATENGFSDLFLLNSDKRLARSVKGSIFLIEGNTIKTPKKEEGAKNGVFREKIIDILRKSPEFDEVEETEIFPFALQKADEVFILEEGIGIQALSQFRKKKYSKTTIESIVANRVKEQLN